MAAMRGRAIRTKDIELRDTHFEDASDRVWDRNRNDGYATVPKTMPLLIRALDELSKGKPLGQTYFALWCATWDNGFVRFARSTDLAYASGLTGPRGVRGWQERVKLLEGFGFVEIVPSGAEKLGLAFLPNPNVVLIDLWAQKREQAPGPYDPPGLAGLQDATMSAFLERAIDVGANDVTRAHAKMNAAKRKSTAPATSPKSPARLRKPPKRDAAKRGV